MAAIVLIVLMTAALPVLPTAWALHYKIGLVTWYGRCCSGIPGELLHSAISIAVDNLVRDGVLPHGNFSVVWRHSGTPAVGMANAVDFALDENVDVIFGSPYSSVSIATGYLTSYWNLPQISWGSTTPVLTNKTEFATFVRTLGPFSKIGLPVLSLFRELNWKRVGLLYYNSAICKYAVDGIREKLMGSGVLLVDTISYKSKVVSTQQMDAYLVQLKMSSRIIILCEKSNLRRYMLRACANLMCTGEYVFMRPMFVTSRTFDESKLWEVGDADDDAARHAYRYLLYITIAPYYNEQFRRSLEHFNVEVIERMAEPPWNNDYGLKNNMSASVYAPFLYDAMYFYGLWLNYSTEHGLDMRNGREMIAFSNGLKFDGIAGPCLFDDNGDRIPLYWIWDFTHPEGYPRIAAIADTTTNVIQTDGWKGFHWQTKDGMAPPDSPVCGFHNELCPVISKDTTAATIGICVWSLAVVAVVAAVAYIVRKRQLEERIMKMIWKVDIKDIEFQKHKGGPRRQSSSSISRTCSLKSSHSRQSEDRTSSLPGDLMTEVVGLYKGQRVAIRTLPRVQAQLTRRDLVELKECSNQWYPLQHIKSGQLQLCCTITARETIQQLENKSSPEPSHKDTTQLENDVFLSPESTQQLKSTPTVQDNGVDVKGGTLPRRGPQTSTPLPTPLKNPDPHLRRSATDLNEDKGLHRSNSMNSFAAGHGMESISSDMFGDRLYGVRGKVMGLQGLPVTEGSVYCKVRIYQPNAHRIRRFLGNRVVAKSAMVKASHPTFNLPFEVDHGMGTSSETQLIFDIKGDKKERLVTKSFTLKYMFDGPGGAADKVQKVLALDSHAHLEVFLQHSLPDSALINRRSGSRFAGWSRSFRRDRRS